MTPNLLVEVQDLHRHFGRVRAVDGVTFALPRGTVTGFIGANGAGKTTTLRLIATLDLPDGGRVLVDGADVVEQPARVRRIIGWMPDHVGPYDDTSVLDYLDFFARAHRLRGEDRTRRLAEVIHFTDLDGLLDRPMKALSKGQAQRMSLARTLIHDPDLLILDEPAAGLDPKARVEFKNLVQLLRRRGKTILISSHILSELGEMCDRLLFIDAGRLVFHGTADELQRRTDAQGRSTAVVDLRVAGDREPLVRWLQDRPGWRTLSATPQGARAEHVSSDPGDLAAELRSLVESGVTVCGFGVQERRLEEAFIDVLHRGSRPAGTPQAATMADEAVVTPPPLPPGA